METSAFQSAPQIFSGRSTAKGGLYFSVGFFVVMSLATLGLLFMKPFWSGSVVVVVIGCAVWGYMLRLTFQGLSTTTSRIVLDSHGISSTTGSQTKSILWSDIEKVEDGNRSIQQIKLRIRGGQTLLLQLFYIEDGKELGRILKQIINGSHPTAPSAIAAPAPVAAHDFTVSRTFRPKATAWGAPVAGILMFGLFTFGGVGMITTSVNTGQTIIGSFFIAIFGTFTLVSIAMLAISRTVYELSDDGIEARSLFGKKQIEWSAVESAFRSGSEMTGYELVGGSQKLSIETGNLSDGAELIQLLDTRFASVKTQSMDRTTGRSFGMDPSMKWLSVFLFGIFGPVMVGFGIYACMGGLARPNRPQDTMPSIVMGVMFLLCGGLLLYAIPIVMMRRFIPHAHSLEVRTIKGTRTVDYDRLRRVELGTRRQPKSNTLIRTMTLEHPDGEVRIDSNIQDFGMLQDYILAHVDPSIVRDSRPAGG